MRLINFVVFFFVSLNSFALTQEEEKKFDEFEGVDFLRALSKEKKFQEVLKYFPRTDKSKRELSEAFYLLGHAQFHLKMYQEAETSLVKAMHEPYPALELRPLLAKTRFHLKDEKGCVDAYESYPLKEMKGEDWNVFFSCHSKDQGHLKKSLDLALNLKSTDPDFFIQSQRALISSQLLNHAEEIRNRTFGSCLDSETYLRLWSSLEDMKFSDIKILEAAHACYPENLDIIAALIKALFTEGKFHSISYLFERMSLIDREYVKHAAEFYKVAGRGPIADYFFLQVDQQDYILHKTDNYLNQENFAGLLSIPFEKKILSLHKDLNYAVAYSYFKFRSLQESRSIMGFIDKGPKFKQLQVLVSKCEELGWKCRP